MTRSRCGPRGVMVPHCAEPRDGHTSRGEHPLPLVTGGCYQHSSPKSGNGAHSAKGSKVSSFYVGGPVTLYVCLYWYSGIDGAIDC